MRNVKIVATVGPASSSPEILLKLFEAGVDVFRLNMSHGSHADIAERHGAIRAIEVQTGRPIGILADLQGPKLRVGRFKDGSVMLVVGQSFRLDLSDTPGDLIRVQLPHPEIFAALRPGASLLVNDGKIRLTVTACDPEGADCTVAVGGKISDNKGVNVPDVVLPLAALTDKDRRDLDYVLGLGVDWLALSFVQRPEDVLEARALIGDRRVGVMAKIEKPAGVARFDEILDVVDGIMVARGDLGVELPVAELPPLQGEAPSAARVPSGCRFHPRCPLAFDRCRSEEQMAKTWPCTHGVAATLPCHLTRAGLIPSVLRAPTSLCPFGS